MSLSLIEITGLSILGIIFGIIVVAIINKRQTSKIKTSVPSDIDNYDEKKNKKEVQNAIDNAEREESLYNNRISKAGDKPSNIGGDKETDSGIGTADSSQLPIVQSNNSQPGSVKKIRLH